MAEMNCCERTQITFEDTGLYKFLGEEDSKKFKELIIETLVEQIKSDLETSHYYLITPDDVEEMVKSIADEIKEEVKKEFASEIKNKIKEDVIKSIL